MLTIPARGNWGSALPATTNGSERVRTRDERAIDVETTGPRPRAAMQWPGWNLTLAVHSFHNLYMRSADLTAAAAIRESAMRLFAERGVAAVSVRDIAAAAGVSPSLVIHHYKSKAGLRAAVDDRALTTLLELLAEFSAGGTGYVASMAGSVAERLGTGSEVSGYVRRLLVDGGPAAEILFRALFDATHAMLIELEASGTARSSDDLPARAAFLLVNDLALILLRDQITLVLGVDPLSELGVARWTETVLDVYTGGVFVGPDPFEAS